MGLHQDISDLIVMIYRGANCPSSWDKALDGLIHHTGSRFAMVSAVDLNSGTYSTSRFHGADDGRFLDGVRDYHAYKYQTDPMLAFGRRHPDAGFVSLPMALHRHGRDWQDDPYAVWTRDMLGAGASVVCYSKPEDDLMVGVSVHPAAAHGSHDERDIRLLRMLFGHMQHAAQMTAHPVDLASTRAAVLMLDGDGVIVGLSPPAERILAAADGFDRRNRRLWIAPDSERVRFETLLRSALTATGSGGSGGGMRVSRPSARLPWIVRISPLPLAPSPFGRQRPAAIVRILNVDPPSDALPDPLVQQLFGLTPTEAAVAAYLRTGVADSRIAARLHVRVSTIRSHVKAILMKMGVHSKAELAHLLTTLSM